jgi:hypothetical protein
MIKRKQDKNLEPQEIKSRAKYKCPLELEALIERVNLVPFDKELPKWDQVYKKNEQTYVPTGFHSRKSSEIFRLTNEECLSYLPDSVAKNICIKAVAIARAKGLSPETLKFDLLTNAAKRDIYMEFCQNREDLRKIAVFFAIKRKGEDPVVDGKIILANETFYELPAFQWRSTELDNKICFTPIGLAELLEGLDCDRIRSCVICNQLFWAKRGNESKTCSRLCLKIFHMRRNRALPAEVKAERKAQREANRKYVKDKIAKPTKRSNKNGIV